MAIITNPIVTISPSVVSAAISGTTAASASTATAKTDATKAADTYNQFLKLLTTQLQHQDPTAPLDTNQFTQQLVQFSQVEQQLKSNAKLDTLIANTGAASQVGALLGYVGLTATVNSPQATLASGGSASWTVTSPSAVQNANVVILDASGNQVASYKQNLTSGAQAIVWDGTNASGAASPAGSYSIKVTGTNSAGTSFSATTTTKVKITGVDTSSGTANLIAGNLSFTPAQVIAVSQ